jgi:catechol 2,3-dioxygenase-like lactoylglutathione lyase family enzyme
MEIHALDPNAYAAHTSRSDQPMKQSLAHIALVVRDYDEAIAFFTQKLNFTLLQDIDQPEQHKRWVLVAPPGSEGANSASLLLARASTPEQEAFIGNQAGGACLPLFANR